MTAERAVEIAAKAVDAGGTLHSSAFVTFHRVASVRFGKNSITQNQDTGSLSVTLTVGDGARKASVSFEDTTPESMERAASKARAIMEASPPDPEYMPPPEEGQVYPFINDAVDPEAAECPVARRIEAVRGLVDTAEGFGLEVGGICSNSHTITAHASSIGNLASHEKTAVTLSFTMDRGNASSFRQLHHESWSAIPWREASEQVAREALANADQKDAEPGEYSIVFEPQAVADLLPFLAWSMDARRADEGLTFFSGMQGKQVSGQRFTLRSDPDGPAKGVPFNNDGVPSRDAVWIRNGTLENLPSDRYWAAKTGREPLFIPDCLEMKGDSGSTRDLIRKVKRGILVRRLWYIRFVDQKTLLLTGMTRDGVFMIRDGRPEEPLRDFRWNWRPLELFERIEALGSPERKSYAFVPTVVVGGVKFPCV